MVVGSFRQVNRPGQHHHEPSMGVEEAASRSHGPLLGADPRVGHEEGGDVASTMVSDFTRERGCVER